MLDQDVLEGKWHTVRGKLRNKWGKLTDDDLAMVDGGIEALIGRIQRRTGESREAIEHFLDQAAGQISESTEQLGYAAHEAAHEVRQRVRARYQQAEQVIHDRPAQAVLVAFGLGLVSGLGAALLLTSSRNRPAESTCASLRHSSEQLAKHLSDVIMNAMPQSLGGRR